MIVAISKPIATTKGCDVESSNCEVLIKSKNTEIVLIMYTILIYILAGQYLPLCEMKFELRFADGPIVATDYMLAVCSKLPYACIGVDKRYGKYVQGNGILC